MLNLLHERVKHCRFENKKRLKDIIIQRKSSLKSSVLSSGSTFAIYYASRNTSLNHNLNDRFTGISHIRFITDLADNFDDKCDEIVNKLKLIQSYLMNKNRTYFSFVGSDKQKPAIQSWVNGLTLSFNNDRIIPANYNFTPSYQNSEAICLSAQVAYNALTFPAVPATDKNAAPLFLIGQYLSFNYLWDKIRIENGAYGANSFFSTLGGIFGISTYRDPHIIKSYDTFHNCADHILKTMKQDKAAIELNIIGSLKKLDKPVRPGNAVNLALSKYLRNVTDNNRYNFRQKLLNITFEDIQRATEEVLIPGIKKASICTISNKKKIETVHDKDSKYKFKIEYM